MGFSLSRPIEWGCWSKSHGTHNAPFFPAGEISLPRLEKYCILDLLVVGNGGPLMLVCSNVHVSGGFPIFGNTFNIAFRVSHRLGTHIKGCRVMDSFELLAGFEFSSDVYGLDVVGCCQYWAFLIAPVRNVILIGVDRRLQGTC